MWILTGPLGKEACVFRGCDRQFAVSQFCHQMIIHMIVQIIGYSRCNQHALSAVLQLCHTMLVEFETIVLWLKDGKLCEQAEINLVRFHRHTGQYVDVLDVPVTF